VQYIALLRRNPSAGLLLVQLVGIVLYPLMESSARGRTLFGVFGLLFRCTCGGHSLLATQVIARIRSTFATDLSVRVLFGDATVAGLSAQILDTTPDERRRIETTAELFARIDAMDLDDVRTQLSQLNPV